MRPLLVLRPEPGATRTAKAARVLGLEALVVPLFEIAPLDWQPPPADRFDAIMFTSANALAHGGDNLTKYRALSAYAVGGATAEATRAAGFTDVREGAGDATALATLLATDRRSRVLYLGGADRRDADAAGVEIERIAVYRSRALDRSARLPTALARAPVALVHSPRAAARLAELTAFGERTSVTLAAISAAAAEAAGPGWRHVAVAERPDDAALLELAARLCDTGDE